MKKVKGPRERGGGGVLLMRIKGGVGRSREGKINMKIKWRREDKVEREGR